MDAADKIVATLGNFAAEVVEVSKDRPVLVDFWAPWCGPCRTLMPMLDRIADDYAGRLRLAKVNTDEEQQLAGHFGIRSIPTVVLFRDGRIAEQFVGVQPEPAIRAMIDRHSVAAVPEAEGPAVQARGLATAGDLAGARLALEQALADRPQDAALLLELASLQLRSGDGSAAAATLARAEAAGGADETAVRRLRALLAFQETVAASPDAAALRAALDRDPAASAARHALASHHALAGDFATAMSEWLDLLRRDRAYGDDAARRSLLACFDVLGEGHELVAAFRRRMASALH